MFQFTHPGKGATQRCYRWHRRGQCFNSRTLGRVRRVVRSLTAIPRAFQFTHPGKGATIQEHTIYVYKVVSIHAPWEGCDSIHKEILGALVSFNSRTLGRVRRIKNRDAGRANEFQFTHPGKGATPAGNNVVCKWQVSIHAPWEGCDWVGDIWTLSRESFNSRTLGRVRLYLVTKELPKTSFNSRTLGRVRLQPPESQSKLGEFQFTHPGKGATYTPPI